MKKLLLAGAAALTLFVTPALATISSSTVVAVDAGNGSTTAFNYGFLIPYQADGATPAVTVQIEDSSGNLTTLNSTQYVITGVGVSSGGTVNFTTGVGAIPAPLPTGYSLIISRGLAYTQPIAVQNFSFYPHTVEITSDNLAAQIQQLNFENSQTVRAPGADTLTPLPSAIQRANSYLGFDANGNPLVVPSSGTLPPIGSQPPNVIGNTALGALGPLYSYAVRTGFTTVGDTPPLGYTYSSSACSLASGAGDGGSQVQSGSGCRLAVFPNGVTQGGLRIEWWGIAQGVDHGSPAFKLYVNHASGSDTNNYCTVLTLPCATWTRAVAMASLFDAEGGNIIIHDTDTGAAPFVESPIANNPLRGGTTGTVYPCCANSGFGPSMIILDGNNEATITGLPAASDVCYTVAANNGAIIGLENITIAANTTACGNGEDDLFAQQNGGIVLLSGWTLGVTGSGGYKAHTESSVFGIQIWGNGTVSGNGAGIFSAGPNGEILINSGFITISGSPTYTNMILVGAGSTFQTDEACPFGATAWSSSPTYGQNSLVLGSDNNCYGSATTSNHNHNPVGDGGTNWTQLTTTGMVPAIASVTGPSFGILLGGHIETQAEPIAWPGTSGILYGGSYRGDGLLVGSKINVTGSTGVGGGAAVSVSGNSYDGEVTIVAGTSPSALGTVSLSFPFLVQYTSGAQGHCSLSPALESGGTSWNVGVTMQGSLSEPSSGTGISFPWNNNSTSLTNTDSYSFNYHCGSGS